MKTFNIIKVSPQGYCGGVLKAIEIAKQTRNQFPTTPITILGNLVHNEYVKKALSLYQINTIEDPKKNRMELLDEVQEGIIIFTAHGVSKDVQKKAQDKGLQIVDASCPFVLQTQNIIHQKLEEGYTILYIGKNHHPEAEAIYTMSDKVHLIQPNDLIPDDLEEPIFVTNQTTMSIMDIKDTFHSILNQYPNAEIHDEICNATRIRQQAVLNLIHQNVDTLIVVGDPTSNNTKQLANIGKQAQIPQIIEIQDVSQLQVEQLKKGSTIAITSGASTPTYLTEQITTYLEKYPCKKQEIRIQDIL